MLWQSPCSVSSYEDIFKGTVLPSFERACQEMFRQVDEAFKRGTSECELGTRWRGEQERREQSCIAFNAEFSI